MNLIGKKIKGFRFETKKEVLEFHPNMDKYIGEIGEINSHYPNDSVRVKFKDNIWYYPLPEALEHLVQEEPIIPELNGVEMEVSITGKNWSKQIVFGTYNGKYITNDWSYTKARPITVVKKLTMEELEALVGGKFEIVNEK